MFAQASTIHVLDFDGVICDGLDECMLTAWIAANQMPLSHWSIRVLEQIPPEFRRHFRHARNFVRHDGHFLVPIMAKDPFANASAFESLYLSIPQLARDEFRERFRAVREHIRTQRYEDWIALHQVYEPVIGALRRLSSFYIVSGKDADSIVAILSASNVGLSASRIHGSQTNKIPALLKLKQQASEGGHRIIFCDDNLPNVLSAKAAGIESVWAEWGYHVPDDIAEAARSSVRMVGLHEIEDFLSD